MPDPSNRTLRLLVILPSWIGDAVMATPALRRIRDARPGTFVGALARPGAREILAGSNLIDAFHTVPRPGVMGPARTGVALRRHAYDTALILPNSFATALTARVARIPRRIGYARDARGILLTDPLTAPRGRRSKWALVPAVNYYWAAAGAVLGECDHTPACLRSTSDNPSRLPLLTPPGAVLELAITPEQERAAAEVLDRAGITPGTPYALLNPGGNNPAKRWPAERFAQLADHLAEAHALRVLINVAPGERDIARAIIDGARAEPVSLADCNGSLAALKGVVRGARLMVTNDTGPRHIAAALAVPLVSLFGPTDARWTTIPTRPLPDGEPSETIVLADPTLPPDRLANDDPERCRIDRIAFETVRKAADAMLARAAARA